MPVAKLFSNDQERRFRLWLAEMRATSDFRSSLSTVLVLLLIIPKYPFTGSQEEYLPQAALLWGMILGSSVPPLVQKALGREHYVRWRGVYLPVITALDALALLRLRGWELLPNVQSGAWARLAFKVYCVATSHLFTLCLFRTLVFRHHAVMQTGLLGAGLVCVWHHCQTLGCKYEPDFHAWADLQRWAALPALVAPLPLDLAAAVVGELPLLGEGAEPGERAQGCQQACFIVHGTAVALLGFLLPLTIVYNRERQLRKRFLAEEAAWGRLGRAEQAALQAIDPPGASAPGQVLLSVMALSGLCLAVRVLAVGGLEELLYGGGSDRSSP